MRVGVKLPTSGPFTGPDTIASLAKACEKFGYDSVWVQDHVSRSAADVEHHFGAGAWEAWRRPIVPDFYEALCTLVYLSAVTTRVILGTSALVMPLRNPVWLAKEAACLDQFSSGRLVLGVAVGGAYVRRELAALGRADLAGHRGKLAEEWLDIVRGVWTESKYSYSGRFYEVIDAEVFPKPKQELPPVWIGGISKPARDRVARRGDGWLSIFQTPADVKAAKEGIVELAEKSGRNPDDITISTEQWLAIDESAQLAYKRSEVTRKRFSSYLQGLAESTSDDNVSHLSGQEDEYSLIGDPDIVLSQVHNYGQAGADHLTLRLIANSLSHAIESLQLFSERVMPYLPEASNG